MLIFCSLLRVVVVTFGSGVNETFGEDEPGTAWPEGSFPPQSLRRNIPALFCSIRPNVHSGSELQEKQQQNHQREEMESGKLKAMLLFLF
ncbi:uncharacterized [Tachysurus ichikawai]